MLYFLGIGNGLPSPKNISFPPSAKLPEGFDGSKVSITSSEEITIPDTFPSNFVAIGEVYEVNIDGFEITPFNPETIEYTQVYFPGNDLAELTFNIDKAELESEGFNQEFQVWYFDLLEQRWRKVEKVLYDEANSQVKAYTSHFTSFILTAMPKIDGTDLATIPACLNADLPFINLEGVRDDNGISQAVFTTTGEGFLYLKDRAYYVKRDAGSFQSLGFEGALAIATCQGGGDCGANANHKYSTSSEYIRFTAWTDIDVYVLYDTRGGSSAADSSQDADWLQAGFTQIQDAYIYTTDIGLDPDPPSAGNGYKVYRNNTSYLKGSEVSLGGNWKGATSNAIQSNYWVIIKPIGTEGRSVPSSLLCSNPGSFNLPKKVTNLKILPGQNSATLVWQNPDNPKATNILVRRSPLFPPLTPGSGEAPSGSSPHNQAFTDTGLINGASYYYSVFALDNNGNYDGLATVQLQTGTDTDGDGLSDLTEISTDLSDLFGGVSRVSLETAADTDGDGLSDAIELINGTDPSNADSQKPIVTQFQYTGSTPTTYPYMTFDANATDNVSVTGWALTSTNEKPLSYFSEWSAIKPNFKEFSKSGSYNLYLWTKDAAGNVSDPYTPASYQLDGIKLAKFVYATQTSANKVLSYSINPFTGALENSNTFISGNIPTILTADPLGSYVLIYYTQTKNLVLAKINRANGSLVTVYSYYVSSTLLDSVYGLTMDPTGSYIYAAGYKSNPSAFSILKWNLNRTLETIVLDQTFLPTPSIGDTGSRLKVSPNGSMISYIWATGDSQSTYGSIKNFLINPLNGRISTTQTVFSLLNSAAPYAFDYLGNGNTMFIVSPNSLSTESETGLKSASSVVFAPLTGQSVSGFNQAPTVNTFALGVSGSATGKAVYVSGWAEIENQNEITVLNLPNPSAAGTVLQRLSVTDWNIGVFAEKSGRYLYSVGSKINSFLIDPGTGQLNSSSVQTISLPETVTSFATVAEQNSNDPPVALLEITNSSDNNLPQNIRVNRETTISSRGSFDPNMTSCSVNPNTYVRSWRWISKPVGSNANFQITDSTSSVIKFTPDVPGNYTIEFSITDSPGTCQGSSRTDTTQLTVSAKYFNQVLESGKLLVPMKDAAKYKPNPTSSELPGVPSTAAANWIQKPVIDAGAYTSDCTGNLLTNPWDPRCYGNGYKPYGYAKFYLRQKETLISPWLTTMYCQSPSASLYEDAMNFCKNETPPTPIYSNSGIIRTFTATSYAFIWKVEWSWWTNTTTAYTKN
ncbi:thrombospondin type 3 repeat-containing protein [Leptospira koniambonensis]|nr:thrombospondin type 3 repeat-containing protein [Leptospira koniambonensis]